MWAVLQVLHQSLQTNMSAISQWGPPESFYIIVMRNESSGNGFKCMWKPAKCVSYWTLQFMDETCVGGTVEISSIHPSIHPSIHVCILLYICGLFNDVVSSTDFIVLNGTVIHELWICNDVETSCQGENLHDERKKMTQNLNQDGWWTGRDANCGHLLNTTHVVMHVLGFSSADCL